MSISWRWGLLALLWMLAPAATAQQADTQAKAIPYKQDSSAADALWRAGLGLIALGAIALGVVYGYKRLPRLKGASVTRRLKVVETLRLSPRTTLFLVEMDRKSLLLSLSGQETRVLVPPQSGGENAEPAP